MYLCWCFSTRLTLYGLPYNKIQTAICSMVPIQARAQWYTCSTRLLAVCRHPHHQQVPLIKCDWQSNSANLILLLKKLHSKLCNIINSDEK